MTMTKRSFAPVVTATMLAGLLFASIAAIEAAVAEPVEVTVLTSVALTSAMDELAPQFERATGNKLKIGYSLIADIKKRVLAGEAGQVCARRHRRCRGHAGGAGGADGCSDAGHQFG
jgi:ABC-type molybdate transport system substrate-binding protein